MNTQARFAVVAFCSVICAGAVILTKNSGDFIKISRGSASFGGCDLTVDYFYATSGAPLKLSLNQIESIIRDDSVAKSHHGKMEFGSVKVDRGVVIAEVLFLEKDGNLQAFLYSLKHKSDSWYVANAQRIWFVPRSQLLRGLRV
jgi:hypothetical protein